MNNSQEVKSTNTSSINDKKNIQLLQQCRQGKNKRMGQSIEFCYSGYFQIQNKFVTDGSKPATALIVGRGEMPMIEVAVGQPAPPDSLVGP